MNNIIKIYEKYYIPSHLQMHMLRVAACANFIIDNWIGKELNKDSIIKVSLLHDMGNILKTNENEIQDKNLIELRKKYFIRYGENDHLLNLEIAQNEGLNKYELEILDAKRSRNNEQTLKSNSYEIKICAYCDQRVTPNGVTGIKERLEDAKTRYKDKPMSVWSDAKRADELIDCALNIEKQIMKYCNLKPEQINNYNIQEYIEKLKAYNI